MKTDKDRIFDLHAHPSLRIHYLPWISRTFHTGPYYSGPHFNPFEFRTNYANLDGSPIKVLMNAHYVIEYQFLKSGFTDVAKRAFWAFAPTYYGGLRLADPWKTLHRMIDKLNVAVVQTNKLVLSGESHRFKVCTSFADIGKLEGDEIGFVHAVEGAHAISSGLEKLPRDEQLEQTRKRLAFLKKHGVACICPSHFYDNLYSPQAESTEIIPKKVRGKIVAVRDSAFFKMRRAEWTWDDKDHLAHEFYDELFRQGFVVDLSHTQEAARMKVYEIAKSWGRPLILSHVGLKHFFDHEYNVSDDEIRTVHSLGGVVGLILSRRWLVDPETRYYSGNDGIPDLIRNMLHIRDVCGDINAIGIGTDFDGMTHPFGDCFKPNQLDRVIHAMKTHFTDQEVDQILFGNAMRVMQAAWLPS